MQMCLHTLDLRLRHVLLIASTVQMHMFLITSCGPKGPNFTINKSGNPAPFFISGLVYLAVNMDIKSVPFMSLHNCGTSESGFKINQLWFHSGNYPLT